jgi:2'-5' RNA ligase
VLWELEHAWIKCGARNQDTSTMADQFSLDGFDAPTQPSDRLFFALLPDGPTIDRVAALTKRLRLAHGLAARPIPAERLHVTLHHLGDFVGMPTRTVSEACAVASSLAQPSFGLAFEHVATFSGKPGRLPLVLREGEGGEGVAAVAAFQSHLDMALTRAGLSKGSRATYTPHLTLLYGDRRLDEQLTDPIGWAVQEFVLVHSLIGQGRYTVIGRWALRA